MHTNSTCNPTNEHFLCCFSPERIKNLYNHLPCYQSNNSNGNLLLWETFSESFEKIEMLHEIMPCSLKKTFKMAQTNMRPTAGLPKWPQCLSVSCAFAKCDNLVIGRGVWALHMLDWSLIPQRFLSWKVSCLTAI